MGRVFSVSIVVTEADFPDPWCPCVCFPGADAGGFLFTEAKCGKMVSLLAYSSNKYIIYVRPAIPNYIVELEDPRGDVVW